jgi:hypothetical protein
MTGHVLCHVYVGFWRKWGVFMHVTRERRVIFCQLLISVIL